MVINSAPAILKRLTRHKIYSVLVLLGTVVILSAHALAASYGSGPYGTCGYAQNCAPSTVVTVPPSPPTSTTPAAPALQVNINLKNGQTIPRPGYKVIVTPLNGKGTSFASVDFYVDGTLIHTQKPDEEGTATWFWNVNQFPGSIIKVVVNGQDGQTVSSSFHVKIAAVPVARAVKPAASTSILQRIVTTPRHIIQSVTKRVAELPRQVKYSLPYFLFLVLAGDMILLLIRARHEVSEAKRLQILLGREQQNGELKHTFLQLISHYFRTPITLIKGGLEMTGQLGIAGPVKTTADNTAFLAATIDDMLGEFAKQASAAASAAVPFTKSRTLWQQASFFVPISLIGFVAFCFDYLAHHGGSFDLGQINLIIQLVLFGSLTVVIYQTLRYRQLKQWEQATTARILDQEVAFTKGRDQAIEYGATQIKTFVDKIGNGATQIQMPEAKHLVTDGATRLRAVVNKLLIANQLKGSHSVQPYTLIELDQLVHQALVGLEDRMTQKMVHLQTLHNVMLKTQNIELLAFVLRTILDNAIAYSPKTGAISVDAVVSHDSVSISVVDQGVGIAADKKFALFQAFSKTEGAETFNHEGMGFSLYLDKLIMNYLVGDIRVDSTPGEGTVVVLSLPQPLEQA